MVTAFAMQSAVLKIHFSFRIAPEQNVGLADGLSWRYFIAKDACHGNSPISARSPFTMRGCNFIDAMRSYEIKIYS